MEAWERGTSKKNFRPRLMRGLGTGIDGSGWGTRGHVDLTMMIPRGIEALTIGLIFSCMLASAQEASESYSA